MPVIKTEAQWQSRLGHLMDALGEAADASVQEGLGYEQYLLALVVLQSQKKLAYGCMDPVSYTHLDVYKRQVTAYARAGSAG